MKTVQQAATPAKIQVICKINQFPEYYIRPDKNYDLFLRDDMGRIFTTCVKPKVFKKLSTHGFESWVAAITGDLGAPTHSGFELLNPAVQIFEKKQKQASPDSESPENPDNPKPETPANNSNSQAQTTAVDPPQNLPAPKANKADKESDKPVERRKSLLKGVHFG